MNDQGTRELQARLLVVNDILDGIKADMTLGIHLYENFGAETSLLKKKIQEIREAAILYEHTKGIGAQSIRKKYSISRHQLAKWIDRAGKD